MWTVPTAFVGMEVTGRDSQLIFVSSVPAGSIRVEVLTIAFPKQDSGPRARTLWCFLPESTALHLRPQHHFLHMVLIRSSQELQRGGHPKPQESPDSELRTILQRMVPMDTGQGRWPLLVGRICAS